MKLVIKIFKIIAITVIIITFILCVLLIIYFFDNKDACLDTNICKDGLKVNTEYGLVKINKENCLKYNWKWDDKSKYCDMRNDNK